VVESEEDSDSESDSDSDWKSGSGESELEVNEKLCSKKEGEWTGEYLDVSEEEEYREESPQRNW